VPASFSRPSADSGLRWQLFHDLIFFVFLPVLILEAAFNIDIRQLLRDLPLILLLALPLIEVVQYQRTPQLRDNARN
jgi:hypothetical protein